VETLTTTPWIGPQTGTPGTDVEVDERAARAALRGQIARLERTLEPGWRVAAQTGGPQLLGLGELERVRDRLVDAIAAQRRHAEREAETVEAARLRLESMLADPERHRFARITLDDLGLPGCGAYSVRPRLGLIGMLAGWWEIRMSSGCP
jgi:hypothetical protein